MAVIALGADHAGFALKQDVRVWLIEIVEAWLATPFEGGRHARRVGKLADLDAARTEKKDVNAAAR